MNAGRGREQIKVLLVDDHAILREGVHALLAREPDILVVGEAGDGQEALEQVPRLKPDVVIMDIVMPRMNGLEATRLIAERHPKSRVLILSMYDDHEYVVQIIQAGASGYVLKRVVTEDLVRAIHEVHAGGSFLYPPIAAKLIGDYLKVTKGERRNGPGEPLTAREREVLKLIADGHTNHAIAEQLGLSRKTVDSHRSNAMRKLDLHDVTEVVKYAIRTGLITLD
ncbi:MAG TPA: response regulator transcription factor [Thermoleophilia bacterium]|nr:response regulator transcription factor [Thermoleophilia bacterium]